MAAGNSGIVTVNTGDVPSQTKFGTLMKLYGDVVTCHGISASDKGDGTYDIEITLRGPILPLQADVEVPTHVTIEIGSQPPTTVTVVETV